MTGTGVIGAVIPKEADSHLGGDRNLEKPILLPLEISGPARPRFVIRVMKLTGRDAVPQRLNGF